VAPGLLASDGSHLPQRGKREGLCSQARGAHCQSFTLDSEREGDGIRLAHDQQWDDTPRSEGRGASKGPQHAAQRRAGYTAARLKPDGDKPGAPKVTGANRETPVKYLRGTKGCSSSKGTRPTA